MNVLEAEDRGRPRLGSLFLTMRPAVIILGDRRQGTAAGCVMKILEAERWLKGANPSRMPVLLISTLETPRFCRRRVRTLCLPWDALDWYSPVSYTHLKLNYFPGSTKWH